MHVLRRPRLPRAVMITTIAAVLAFAASLILASAVSDVYSSWHGSSAPPVSTPPVHRQTVGPVSNGIPFAPLLRTPVGPASNRNPFAPLLRTPVAAPWTERPLVWRADSRG